MNYRDVACPNCGTVYAVGYSDVPHSVEKNPPHLRHLHDADRSQEPLER